MTGHPKEQWVLRLNAGDETRIQADGATGISLAVCDIKCGGLAGRTVAEAEQMAADIVASYNALATIPDPAAFVQAARGMEAMLMEAIERVEAGDLDRRMCCDGHMCGCQGSTNADQFLHYANEKLTAFRAATGEA